MSQSPQIILEAAQWYLIIALVGGKKDANLHYAHYLN
jgi:hypothetical protein